MFHAARSLFPLIPRLKVVSCLSRFSAMRLSTEKFCAACPARLRSRSSLKPTSSTQCSLFSMPQCWRITRVGLAGSRLAESPVEPPVQLVFDAPVLADPPVQPRCIGPEAGDVVADFALDLARALVVALAFNAHQPLQRRPFRSFVDHAQVGDH